MAYQLKEGSMWNPLLKFPRNSPCLCLSGKKYKHCCLKYMPRAVQPPKPKDPKSKPKAVIGKIETGGVDDQ